ncbi:altronate hydrolase [Bacillus sp. TS-2]|nr:altronate hydrolase [Bacillus sp. TS-2]
MKPTYLKVHQDDNVIVTLQNYQSGDQITIDSETIIVKEDTPVGHKIAIKPITPKANIIKYGFPIGHAKKAIEIGDWVHTENVKTNLEGTLNYEYNPKERELPEIEEERTFMAYKRNNGDVGIRNEVWVIPTVGCINKTAELLTKMANEENRDQSFDGVFHYPHPFGCSQLGDDLNFTQRILSNLVQHPNASAVLVLGLGCENNHIKEFKKVLGDYDSQFIRFLGVQEAGDELEEGLEILNELIEGVSKLEREEVPLSKLKIGLKCGGSDGLSGITANPLVGALSDTIISHGGSTVLTEVPEMFGAETILMERAKSQEVFNDIVTLVNDFKEYFIKHDQVVYENPSPGNKDGGITTLEEKSLGCVQKGGFSKIVDVLPYGGRVKEKGLTLVQGPGNDLVSVTALAASGAHIVLFTTGRGTPFGGPVPTVKISTNSRLYHKKKNWIDFNAGELVEGKPMEQLNKELFNYLIDLASGNIRAKNEQFGFKEIAIFKDGVIL